MKEIELIIIDGSAGEGGGQVLRSSLALSLATGRPFRIRKIRSGRPRPGLARQHLTAVQAAAAVGQARVMGAEMASTDLTFIPGAVKAGEYSFAVGTAGSATLVLQTILPVLLTADGPSKLTLKGGTHNRAAPPFEFIDRVFLPQINRMGPRVRAALEKPGFEPAGGGRFTVEIEPSPKLEGFTLLDRGETKRRQICAVVAHLPRGIAENEVKEILRRLKWEDAEVIVDETKASACPGNIAWACAEMENITEMTVGFGRHGTPARRVGTEAGRAMKVYLDSGATVGRHLADQLLLPLALAGGGRFTTSVMSRHTRTQIDTIARFLPIEIEVIEHGRHRHELVIGKANEEKEK